VRALEKKFSQENIHTKILLPEDMMFLDRMLSYIEPTMNDPETRDFNGHFATHRHGKFEVVQQWHEAVKKYDRQYWMTETSGHLPNWQGAFQLAIDMYDYLVGGNFSLWVYWQLSEPEKENVDDNVYTLMIDGKPTPKYYASKHYYRYIRPGAVRIDATSSHPDLLVAAFQHDAEGTLTTVMINKGDQPLEVKVQYSSKKDIPKTFAVYRSSEQENCIALEPIKSKIKKLEIPPKSIITLYGENEALKTKEATATWEVAWQATTTSHLAEKWGSFAPLQEGDGEGIVNMARINRIDLLEQHIEAGKLQATTADGWTALHSAIRSGSAEAIEHLMEAGADINQPAKDGWTPLHAAAATFVGTQHGAGEKPLTKYDIFSMILNQEPDIHAITRDGWTPLHAAAANAHTAWRQERKEVLQKISALVEKGAHINAIDIEGRTPLHYAAWQGHADQLEVTNEVVEHLLKLGADPNINDNWGKTPLHYASEMGYASIVSVLLQYEAFTDIKDNQGQLPVDRALQRNLQNVVQLLTNGSTSATEEASPSPLSSTMFSGHGKLGKALLDAAWKGDSEAVKKYLQEGADVFYKDTDGFRAIDRARDNGHEEIVELLEAAERKIEQ
jgi:ankyrin repeat protein